MNSKHQRSASHDKRKATKSSGENESDNDCSYDNVISDNYGDKIHLSGDNSLDSSIRLKFKRSIQTQIYESFFEQQLNPTKKHKYLDLDDVANKAKQEEKMEFIKRFVRISMTYSHFLEGKIKDKNARNGTTEVNNIQEQCQDIVKRLKYFEGGTLHPYQLEGVTWLTVLFENSVNGILADEMGLGKTIQVIAFICHLYERNVKGPHLIVVPLSTLGNWESEFKKFAPKIPHVLIQGSKEERIEQFTKIQHTTFLLNNKKVKPVILCSYQMPLLEQKFLSQFSWTYLIVDEGHRIKNPESKLTKELNRLRSENRLLLTGTPLQNNITELWALFNFLMPELFNDIAGFSSLVELEDLEDKNKILENEAQTKIITTIHQVLAPFMLRREKKYVLDDLVPKKEVIIYCPLTELQTYIYRAILKQDVGKLRMEPPNEVLMNLPKPTRNRKKVNYNIEYFFDNTSPSKVKSPKRTSGVYEMRKSSRGIGDEDNETQTVTSIKKKTTNKYVPVKCPNTQYICRIVMQNITMMLQKVTNHPYLIWCPLDPKSEKNEMYISEDLVKYSGKLLVLDVLLSKLKAGGHKVLIFSTFTMFLDVIEEFVILRRYNYRRLDGNTLYSDRNTQINEFMTDPSVFLFLLSTKAGGLGLNLTAADTIIFMDRSWNPMSDAQAQDRCHRIGQTKPVMIYSLIAKNTIDEYIVQRGDVKKRLEKLVIKEGKFKTLRPKPSEDELKELTNLLNTEEELTKVHSNGLFQTDKEFDQVLDRSELIKQMKNKH